MSLFRSLLKGLEYKGAIEAALGAYNNGDSLPNIIRSFALETDGTLDDKWARDAEVAIRAVIDKANAVSTQTAYLAGLAEERVPRMVDAISSVANTINKVVVPSMLETDRWIVNNSHHLVDLCAKIGVIAVSISTRGQRLNSDRPIQRETTQS